MPLEPPLSATAQDRLKQVREQIEAALESLVADMVALATAERDTALSEVRAQAAAALEKARSESEAAVAERVAAAQTQAAQAAEAARDAQTMSLQERLATAEAQAARAAAEAEERVQVLTAERTEIESRLAEASADTRVEERQCDLACLERLVDGLRDLDTATTLSQVLDTLGDQASQQVARMAVLIIRDRELRGWRLRGFGESDATPSAVSVPLDAPTVIREAVETQARATTANGASAVREALRFAPLPEGRVGLALPLAVGVRTVAVLYADEGPGGDITVPSAWPEALEILARHAAARLELLTMARAYGLHAAESREAAGKVSQTAGGSSELGGRPSGSIPGSAAAPGARPAAVADTPQDVQARHASEEDASAARYARLLISEIKLYHEDAVNEGRRDANLLARLGPEIARARRLYEERVPAEVRNRADHFGQELVRTLANGDPRLLGQTT